MAETEKKQYTPSEAVELAKKAMEEQEGLRPGAYESLWQQQLDSAMERILNREPFSYDLNGDALYRQYRDQAVRSGRMAMLDTMGQAASLTGGYGNSYAQSVGQQAYQQYLQGLNDRIPELYGLALEQYDRQGRAAQQAYDLYLGREKQDYSRYQDQVAAWQKDADRLRSTYEAERDFDYGAYRDIISDQQWQAEFDEAVRKFNLELALKTGGSGGGGGGTARSSGSGSSTVGAVKTGGYDDVLAKSITLMQSGASYQNIQGYLNTAVKQGAISSSDISSINRKVTDARDAR